SWRGRGEERVEPGAVEDPLECLERVVARRGDHDHRHREGENGRDDRHHDASRALHHRHPRGDAGCVAAGLGRLRRLEELLLRCDEPFFLRVERAFAHATAVSLRRPPVIAIPSSSSLTSGVYSPTIAPSNMTRIRSERDITSSSSSETSRTARPSPRSATSRRCTYSIAPTSSPRVG